MLFRTTFSILILLVMMQYVSCKSSDPAPETEVQKVTRLLIGTGDAAAAPWTLSSVLIDGIDYSEVFTGFTIKFTEGGFTTTNGTVVFAATDSWTFPDEGATKIVSGSGLEMTLVELTDNKLVFSFFWDDTIFGRTSAVEGENVFTLNR